MEIGPGRQAYTPILLAIVDDRCSCCVVVCVRGQLRAENIDTFFIFLRALYYYINFMLYT